MKINYEKKKKKKIRRVRRRMRWKFLPWCFEVEQGSRIESPSFFGTFFFVSIRMFDDMFVMSLRALRFL